MNFMYEIPALQLSYGGISESWHNRGGVKSKTVKIAQNRQNPGKLVKNKIQIMRGKQSWLGKQRSLDCLCELAYLWVPLAFLDDMCM